MKNRLLLLFTLISLAMSGQTNPVVTKTGNLGIIQEQRTGISNDSVLKVPVRGHAAYAPALPMKGRIQVNEDTNELEYYNGTEWVKLSGKADVVNSVDELIAYNGYADMLILSDTATFNQNGLFRYDITEREVDSATVFPATGKGSGYWVRQFDGSPKANYWPVDENINDTIAALYDGHIIQSKHTAQLRAWQSAGTKIIMGFAGSSLMSGTGNEGTNTYGEGSGIIGLTGPTIWGLSIMQADPYFVAPDASVYTVMKPYNNNSVSGPTLNSNKIPIPVHYLTTTANPTLNYNISQQGPVLRDSLTVYYLSRTSSQSASFDITTSLGTTTIDTYEAPTAYTDTLGVVTTVNKTLTLRSKTVAAPASKNYTVTINNIQNEEAGFACIAGFTTGRGVEIHNYGVASSSLVDSYFNEIRGVSARERMDSIKAKNANVIALQWIDARDTLQTGYGSTPEAYGRRLDSLVKSIRNWKHEAVVVLIGNPRPFVDTTDVETRDDIPVYNQIMRRVAIANNVSFIDLQRMMGDDASLRDDYVHFNAKGYRFEGDGISALFGYPPLKATDDNLLRKGDAETTAQSAANNIRNQTSTVQSASARIDGSIYINNTSTSAEKLGFLGSLPTGSGTGMFSFGVVSQTSNGITLGKFSVERISVGNYELSFWAYNGTLNKALVIASDGKVRLHQTPATLTTNWSFLGRDSAGNIGQVAGWLSGSATLDFASTAAGASSELTITVTGAADGDVVSIGVPNASSNANSCFTARVSATNTVTVKFNNYSSGSIDPASGTFKIKVFK